MNISFINTNKAPGAVGPYSQGVKADNLIFTSGQLPIIPETGELLKDDIKKRDKTMLGKCKSYIRRSRSNIERYS